MWTTIAVGAGAELALLIALGDQASPGKERRLADFVFGAEITDGPSTATPQAQESPPEEFSAWSVAPSATPCHG
jgi:hypothetical protein